MRGGIHANDSSAFRGSDFCQRGSTDIPSGASIGCRDSRARHSSNREKFVRPTTRLRLSQLYMAHNLPLSTYLTRQARRARVCRAIFSAVLGDAADHHLSNWASCQQAAMLGACLSNRNGEIQIALCGQVSYSNGAWKIPFVSTFEGPVDHLDRLLMIGFLNVRSADASRRRPAGWWR
jgi:hypothetical protein